MCGSAAREVKRAVRDEFVDGCSQLRAVSAISLRPNSSVVPVNFIRFFFFFVIRGDIIGTRVRYCNEKYLCVQCAWFERMSMIKHHVPTQRHTAENTKKW